ncbi:MAG: carbonic anhydrase family protein [Rhodoferax sp.]|nr:carbonic anhydrase family protein [Rhodoferax sp.]
MNPLPPLSEPASPVRGRRPWRARVVWLMSGLVCAGPVWASDPAPAEDSHGKSTAAAPRKPAPAAAPGSPEAPAKSLASQLKEAVDAANAPKKRLSLVVNGKEKNLIEAPPRPPAENPHKAAAEAAPAVPAVAARKPSSTASRDYIRARAAALAGHETQVLASAAATDGGHGGEVHWSYEGATGPQAWGRLKPEFNLCAIGKRQSPINIEESATLQGPAEALQFRYRPSTGSVVHNGHTVQVDVLGDNTLTVRGATYQLLQFHFHHPSEERVNYRGYSMVAHLVHRNAEGQLAVVAVLLDPGAANGLIHKVWTHMPLDSGDRVRLPTDLLDLNELLPRDQRYYQFMGSLTTPPCTEGVLWMVLKQPTTVSREQIRLFSQLFPNNARPVQPLNGRPVRDAQ